MRERDIMREYVLKSPVDAVPKLRNEFRFLTIGAARRTAHRQVLATQLICHTPWSLWCLASSSASAHHAYPVSVWSEKISSF